MLSQIVVRWNIAVALEGLRDRRVPTSRPLTTPKKKRIYAIGGYILTESEVIALHRDGKLKAKEQADLLVELRRFHECKESGGTANERR